MNKLIKKLDSLYDFSNMTYRYKIGYYADLFSCVFLNIVGIVWVSAPVVALIALIYNTPFSQYQTLTLDHFFGVCLFSFFYFGLGNIFFMPNKSKIGIKLLIFGYSCLGLAFLVMILHAVYHFGRVNIELIVNPSERMWVLYLDLSIVALIAIFYICTHKKVHQFFDRHLTKY